MRTKITNGWLVVFGAVLLQLSIGSIYSWSLFNQAFIDKFGWQENQVVFTFSITVFVFAFITIISGRLQDKLGPRLIASIGGILYGLGLLLTSTSSSIFELYTYYGVISAIGVGFVYVCPLSTCIKWFPEKKGFITGIVVGAFGLGSLVFKAITQYLLHNFGVSQTFFYLGLIHIIITLFGAQFLKVPPNRHIVYGDKAVSSTQQKDFTIKEMIRTKSFYLLWIMFLFGSVSGLLIIGLATDIGVHLAGLQHDVAANSVAIIALFNAGGRIGWGALSDRIGRLKVIFLLFVLNSVSMLFLSFISLTLSTFFITLSVIALCFGGFLSVFPTITGEFYGLKTMGANYGIVYQAYGLSALLGPLIEAGSGSLNGAFIICALLSTLGAALTLMVKKPLP